MTVLGGRVQMQTQLDDHVDSNTQVMPGEALLIAPGEETVGNEQQRLYSSDCALKDSRVGTLIQHRFNVLAEYDTIRATIINGAVTKLAWVVLSRDEQYGVQQERRVVRAALSGHIPHESRTIYDGPQGVLAVPEDSQKFYAN